MRTQFFRAFMVVGVVVTALSSAGCRKSSEEQQREARAATEEAEQKASQTTITSSELPSGGTEAVNEEAAEEARIARERALREHAEAITTARNEQLEYRGKLQAALDQLDAKRRDVKKRGQGPDHTNAVDARRELLKHDLDALDRSTDTEWASLKAKIDRDLKDHAGGEGK